MKYLLTGGAGFAGYYLIQELLKNPENVIYSIERLTQRRDPIDSPQVHKLYHDFNAEIPEHILREVGQVDYIIHLGAEVQGRASTENPTFFVRSNTLGTFNMLEAARKLKPRHFIYVSSGEAVGAAPDGVYWDETAALRPSNPYAAAKAAGEMLCRSYATSFKVPISIVRTMCIFGPRQGTDKFIPMMIKKILNGEPLPLHVDKDGNFGSRPYLPIKDFICGLMNVVERPAGEIYHIVGGQAANDQVADILQAALHGQSEMRSILPGPSHDMRLAFEDTKLNNYWSTPIAQALVETAYWFKEHPEWL